jgi:hypothetical protein
LHACGASAADHINADQRALTIYIRHLASATHPDAGFGLNNLLFNLLPDTLLPDTRGDSAI